ncbi:Conserved oligomeric Golgi complex subunit 1 [Liparis tanakae]|uniref:Conserved oligomeric Golgi complex subunit 1 n=1 Tax=Liparis tanakae TaxID=230148 RepID=A0A4Z2EU39_9TELE|nr:Conserved oligomeric Golgi complex subunit 1 [Liparis tanakae]
MAEDPALSVRVSELRDPDVLFERLDTAGIRGVERRVRADIEHKKEELRQMVGERYRDLIDAADTIGEMRQCSGGVVAAVSDMQRYCRSLKQGSAARHEVTSRQQRSARVALLLSYRWPFTPDALPQDPLLSHS